MKFLFLFLFLAASSSSFLRAQQVPPAPQEGQPGWYQQESGTTVELSSVCFVNKDTGYVGGEQLFRTTNGGKTWLPFGPPDAGYPVFFIDKTYGWVNQVGTGNKVYRTTNGGESWELGGAPFGGNWPAKIRFANKDTGWAVSGQSASRTYDGGQKWHDNFGGSGDFWDLAVFDTKHMLAVGDQYPANKDGCASLCYDSMGYFVRVAAICLNTGFGGIDNLDSVTAITFGLDTKDSYKPKIYRTSNRGFLWSESLINVQNADLLGGDIDFSDNHNGTIIGAAGVIARTTNGGVTWERQYSPIPQDLLAVHFIDSLHGTAVGANGTIIHTTDAGKSWVRQFLPTPVKTSVSPEPFAQKTSITYSLPQSSKATIRIFDMTGRELEVIESRGIQQAGTHTIEFDGSRYPSGAFYYRLEADGVYGTGKMTKIAQ